MTRVFTDLGVGQAPGDQPQHLGFPLGERIQRWGEEADPVAAGGEVRDQALVTDGASRASPAATTRTAVTFRGGSVLEQETARPGPQRRVDVVVEVETW